MKILVILASYNGEKYIEHQVKSIIEQRDVKIDLKIYDDNSKDNTKIIIDRLKFINNNITFVQNLKNSGSAATNFLNALSKNEPYLNDYDFVAFSDQDDVWHEEKLVNATKKIIEKDKSLYCSNLYLWDEKLSKKSILRKDYSQVSFDFLFEGGSAGCTYVFTKKLAKIVIDKYAKINVESWKGFSHDWFVYFLARSNNLGVYIDSNSYIDYRIHTDNVHGHLNKINLSSLFERFRMVNDGWYHNHAKNYINLLDNSNNKELNIYNFFLSNYFSRNFMIIKRNFSLIRDKKKFFVFLLFNLFNFKKNV
ncbi:UDP-Glc:alpha-D-GlcNAc-diphosphoundecaprenol beta-1,3-glucosyltransferase WfgD [Flavobacterium columnare]|uniref:Glycosyltransferase n=2 Tax=Flavobacterium TaxID=237 RepID=A0ABW8PP26_9FLAO|nr:glycosyltransferase [Flavobacterium columnare]SPE76867.1 UDP-Glc:alpha-D-GlcNAc-diphosphoundecaprenol beta-1,3-glucosyltransferase WfgD [Flavobacterium columnare]